MPERVAVDRVEGKFALRRLAVSVRLVRDETWVLDDRQKQTAALLRHEQGHWDINGT